MYKIIAVVGMCGSGKSVASEYFIKKGYKSVYFGGVTMEKLKEENKEINPENEKEMRERLRKIHGMSAYAKILLPRILEYSKTSNVVLDGLYSWDELKVLKDYFKETLTVICIVVNKKNRYERLTTREVRPLTKEEANKRDINELENLAKGGPIAFADYFILNNGTLVEYENELKKIETDIFKEA
ncbi:MAG: AAA family ATPase [Bacilli bacterium]